MSRPRHEECVRIISESELPPSEFISFFCKCRGPVADTHALANEDRELFSV